MFCEISFTIPMPVSGYEKNRTLQSILIKQHIMKISGRSGSIPISYNISLIQIEMIKLQFTMYV